MRADELTTVGADVAHLEVIRPFGEDGPQVTASGLTAAPSPAPVARIRPAAAQDKRVLADNLKTGVEAQAGGQIGGGEFVRSPSTSASTLPRYIDQVSAAATTMPRIAV